jgi:hypothetical protein
MKLKVIAIKQNVMIKITIFAILFVVSATSFCQQIDPNGLSMRDHYQKKSKNQKTAAWFLLGGGTAMVVAARIVAQNQIENDPFGTVLFAKNLGGSAALFAGGICAALGSIPLFVASARNKKKAAEVSLNLKIEKTTAFQKAGLRLHSYPATSLQIKL